MYKTLSIRRIGLLLLFFGLVMIPKLGHADPEAVLEVGRFSTSTGSIPVEWEPLTFKKIPKRTQYKMVIDNGISVVMAQSNRSASGLIRKITVDLKEYPILKWRWKISNVIAKSDPRTKKGDDYAARIYITFAYSPETVRFWKRARYNAGRLLFGDIPIAAINYIWATKSQETILDNAYTDFVKMIVVETGDRKVGQWMTEERNLYDDYRKAFSEEPPLVNGIAIMTDTDNTGEVATAYYGDILFRGPEEKKDE